MQTSQHAPVTAIDYAPPLDECLNMADRLMAMSAKLKPTQKRAFLIHPIVTGLSQMVNDLVDADHQEARKMLAREAAFAR